MNEPNPKSADQAQSSPTISAAPVEGTQDFRPDTLKPGTQAAASAVQVPGYRILGVLGRGGMGVVYHAIQEKANRPVALKMILAGAHADQADHVRFRAEAEAAARLSHPNIVQLFEVGETPEGFPFFSLEYVAGGTLGERLKGGPLKSGEAAGLIEALARAMQYAHERNIVHRDLKPANILMQGAEPKGQPDQSSRPTMKGLTDTIPSSLSASATQQQAIPKISDFGLAKQLDAEDGLTRTGAIMGTPSYMAPEQAFGQSKNVGPAADIYALGAILYECLTGRPPFKGASLADTLEQVRTMEPITVRAFIKEIPRDLETICLHCLHKDPARRYSSAEALAEDLRRYREGQPISVRPVSNIERAWRWCRRNPGWAAMFAFVTILLFGIAGVSTGAYVEVSAQNEVIEKKRKEAVEARKDADEKKILADEQRKRAEASRQKALKAVNLFATDARIYCEDAMVPKASRARLYGVLTNQLEEQAEHAPGEATIDALRDRTLMYQTLCHVTLDAGDGKKSKEWFDKGMAAATQWEKLAPGDMQAQSFRATLMTLRARALKAGRKFEEAMRLDAEAERIRRDLVGDPDVNLPAKLDAITRLADTLDNLEQFEESLKLRTKVLAFLETEEKKHKGKTPAYEEARQRTFPYRDALCGTYTKAGLQASEYAKRKEYLSLADHLSIELLRDRNTSKEARLRRGLILKMLAELEYNYAKLAEKAGKASVAEKHYSQAESLYREVSTVTVKLATSDDLIDGLRDYARSFYTLGLAEKRNGSTKQARDNFKRSLEIRTQTFNDYKNSAVSSHLQIDIWFSQLALGQLKETIEDIRHWGFTLIGEADGAYRMACVYALAIETIHETRKPKPLTSGDMGLLVEFRREAIRCLRAAHDAGFTDFFQSNIDADLDAIRDMPEMKEFEASHQYRQGVIAKNRGDAKKARVLFEQSRDLALEFMKKFDKDTRSRQVKITWLCAQVQLGRHEEAVKSADELRPLLNELHSFYNVVEKKNVAVFQLSRVYALASAATKDPALQEAYRTKALTTLNEAAAPGLRSMLMMEEDLEPIRGDARFTEIMRLYEKLTR